MASTHLVFVCLFVSLVYSKSIQNDTERSTDERIDNLENVVKSWTTTIQRLNASYNKAPLMEEPVMFYALTERTFTLEKLSTVIYEKTIINTGGHYNTFDGVFVAPKSGTYFFSWTSCTNGANYAFTELMVENQLIAKAGVYEHAGSYHCGSMSSLCKMSKEDHAWIRTTPYGAKNYFYFHRRTPSSSFLGMFMSNE
ncbi:unnamed protein product [Mytilus edulis]|uniref:C1q domain-containing protein n=1 Tax=Mytilus edulis TaxID=6550 RepID=A0A8S3S8E2_MYTED|nr:unnamed protein product [Mytilus edulis]